MKVKEKTKTFKPTVNYEGLARMDAHCANELCKAKLDSSNYGEKIDEEHGYLKVSYLVFLPSLVCNTCAPAAVEFLKNQK